MTSHQEHAIELRKYKSNLKQNEKRSKVKSKDKLY